ncbi:Hypothetical protein GLP15_287 [Giardia lamblia P15]|uniref:Uncharacterized protein n=1 Tax=Giardia intestinalis (strain P15) TaxID=658858 RepID=E1EW46_GIAIA|nr:Hypothetical protein GLP15_287 [Giardia lamblia P15]
MPYELAPVASCFHNILGPDGASRITHTRRVELLEAILRVSKEANTGDSQKSKHEVLGSEGAAYTSERVSSLLEAGYSEICSGGVMIFALPRDIVDELRTCDLSPTQPATTLPHTELKDELEHPHLNSSISIYLEKTRAEKARLRRAAYREYSPAHGDLVCSILPSQLSYHNIFLSKKRAYFVVDSTTTPPGISLKIVDQMKLGDRFCQPPFRMYSLERVASTYSSMEHWWPFVIGELIVIYSEANFTKGVHTWSPATTIYRKRHTQFDGSSCITASHDTNSCKSSYPHLCTEYTLQVHADEILVSSYLMGWLRASNHQKVYAISEGFFAEKISLNKLLTILADYVKTIDRYKSTLVSNCLTTKQSGGNRKNALANQYLVGPLPSQVISLAHKYDFLVYPYSSLVANSPVPYIPSSVQSHTLRSLLGDTSNTYLNSQQCYFSSYNYAVDISPVFCCGSLHEASTEESKGFYDIVFDNTLQGATLESQDMMLARDEATTVEPSNETVQRFPTYETLHSYLSNQVTILRSSQVSRHVDTSTASLLSTLLETAEPQIKRRRSRTLSGGTSASVRNRKTKEVHSAIGDTIDIVLHDLIYRELFGDPLRTCRLTDRYDYVLNYHYKKSLDGYFHFNYGTPDTWVSSLVLDSEIRTKHLHINFYTILNVMQRRYTQLAIHNLEVYTLLKAFHAYKLPISLFYRVLSCVTDSLRAYPFGGLFVSLLCHMWLAYDVTNELNCIFTTVWTLFGHSAVESHEPTSLSTLFSYACGNVVIERYFRYFIPWFQRPQTILEFLLLKIQPHKLSRNVHEALRDLFCFVSVINRTHAWYK